MPSVGIVIPTRNVGEILPAHVESINSMAHLVEEIVVADSCSSDGTVEFIKENLRHDRVRYLSLPPGLYEAWNEGIANISTEYCYIATVGDGVDVSVLQLLVDCAGKMEADVVVSPPLFFDKDGRRLEMRWPIHEYIDFHQLREPALIDSKHWFAWNAISVPNTLLGSSASNLYRTAALRESPFPAEYKGGGDAAWALANSFRFRFGICPGVESKFLVHDKAVASRSPSTPLVSTRLRELARKIFENMAAEKMRDDCTPFLAHLDAFLTFKHRAALARSCYREIRNEGTFGYIKPRMWRAMAECKRCEKEALLIRGKVLEALPAVSGKR